MDNFSKILEANSHLLKDSNGKLRVYNVDGVMRKVGGQAQVNGVNGIYMYATKEELEKGHSQAIFVDWDKFLTIAQPQDK